MNHLIFTAVLTACLGIGGYQQSSEFFSPSTEGLGYDPYHNPGQLNSSNTGPWPPLVSPHLTLFIAMYMSAYYILTYFAGSFGNFNIHTKVFRWLMMVYPIITVLMDFQFSNLLPYILQVVPTILGYYTPAPRFVDSWDLLIFVVNSSKTSQLLPYLSQSSPHTKYSSHGTLKLSQHLAP
ncbi:hypothetical protein DSO57_1034678 [Entomophthora muscae]|uniref:Uncharacterized protein n=1 Tax=Entomophthora muscae TaxID=34485 RepID=A0ACC2UKD7_9FUNG|nr:hypothetical protein DSO57_1034678 [Entomophthora muscae]